MAGFREYRIAGGVLDQARALGLTGDTEHRVREMARRAVPYTHQDGNWRYEGYVLWVFEGEIRQITRMTKSAFPRLWRREPLHTCAMGCRFCGGEKKVLVWEECFPCAGPRCSKCGGSGEVAIKRPCAAAMHPTMTMCPQNVGLEEDRGDAQEEVR